MTKRPRRRRRLDNPERRVRKKEPGKGDSENTRSPLRRPPELVVSRSKSWAFDHLITHVFSCVPEDPTQGQNLRSERTNPVWLNQRTSIACKDMANARNTRQEPKDCHSNECLAEGRGHAYVACLATLELLHSKEHELPFGILEVVLQTTRNHQSPSRIRRCRTIHDTVGKCLKNMAQRSDFVIERVDPPTLPQSLAGTIAQSSRKQRRT